MNNSFLASFIDDDYKPIKRGLIVKHDANRSFSRPESVRKPRIPALLEKKVENLEKNKNFGKNVSKSGVKKEKTYKKP